MPRSSRSSRPAPARSAPAPTQTRSASTAAAPSSAAYPHPSPPAPAAAAASAAQPKQPGMLAQMAATAGSVAVGSTIGHGISSMLFGGGGQAAPAQEAPAAAAPQQSFGSTKCDAQANAFTDCVKSADVNDCKWYLEQLQACKAAAAPY